MDPRIILRKLIERLEPEVGKVRRADLGAWGDDEVAAQKPKAESGWFKIATALLDARDALRSGDEARMLQVALYAPTLERAGRALQAKHAVATRRKSGGKRRGAVLAAEADRRWAPFRAKYDALIQAGKKPAVAHRVVKETWKAAHPGELVPSDQTFRTRLRSRH